MKLCLILNNYIMHESLKMAEVPKPANNAGMNYEVFFNYIKNQINLETKKQVAMQAMTHSYVTSMREIAKDEEIVYCFMNEMLMDQSPVIFKSIDVDVKMPTKKEVKPLDVDDKMPTPKIVKAHDNPSKKTTRMTEKELVEFAIEKVEDLPLPEGISAKYSYYACYEFKKSKGELILEKSCGWNEPIEVLEKLKLVGPMRIEDRYRNSKTVVVGDYHVYILSRTKCRVAHYNMTDGVEPYEIDYSNMPIPEEYKEEIENAKFWESALDSASEELACKTNENEESEDSLWDPEIDEWGPVPKKDVVSDDQRLIEKNVVSDEQRLIEKAVEMTKSGGVGMMTDKNAPYYVQNEFKISDTGDLLPAIRPFSRNIRIDEIESFKDSHKKRAQTYNASYVTCTDDYTAYIIDDGKTVCVFYYNTKGMSVTA